MPTIPTNMLPLRGTAAVAAAPVHLLCITLYNEPLPDLQRSLVAVSDSLRHLAATWRSHRSPLGIGLVLDGIEHASPCVLAWLAQLGFDSTPAHTDQWQHTLLPARRLRGGSSDSSDSGEQRDEGTAGSPRDPVPLWVHLKSRNQGKLHSHAVFFETLCRPLQPEVVFQLDVGTTIDRTALAQTLLHFEHDPTVAALSSRCAAEAPSEQAGWVQSWQFFDTTSQLVALWPTEQLSGWLSVIPGQFCALLWKALAPPHGETTSPLQHYLHGLTTSSRYEQTMFLAEDRVIGQALMLSEHTHWRLDYGSDVPATNDACQTFGELLRQRRRWNNGANACRLHLLSRWPAFLQRADRSAAQKVRFSLGSCWQAILLLLQLTAPAAWLGSVQLLWRAMNGGLDRGDAPIVATTLAALAWGLAGTLSGRKAAWAWWIATLGGTLLLWQAIPLTGMLLLVTPSLGTLTLIAVLYPAQRRTVWQRAPEYLWCDGLMRLVLWSYALLRLGDVSWGTKGLHAPARARLLRNPAWWAVSGWIAINVAVLWGLRSSGRTVVEGLPVALAAARAAGVVALLGGIVFFAKAALWPSRKARRRAAHAAMPGPADLREQTPSP